MRWAVLALVAIGACDRVLGLDTQHALPDAPDAAQPRQITIEYKLRTIAGGAGSGAASIVTTDAPYDPSVVVVRVSDGTRVPVDQGGTGTYSFATFGDSYEVQLAPFGSLYTARWQHTASELRILETHLGRTDAVAPTKATYVTWNGSLQLGYSAASLYSLGVWTDTDVSGKTSVNWLTDLPQAGLLSGASHDRLYYLAYTSSSGIEQLASYFQVPDPTMTDGGSLAISGPLVAVTPACATITAPVTSELARFASRQPSQFAGTPTAKVYLQALPGDGITTASGAKLFDQPVAADGTVTAHYGDPIDGTTVNAALEITSQTHYVAIPNTFAHAYDDVFAVISPPIAIDNTCAAGATFTPGALGIPYDLTLDGTALDSDNVAVTRDPATNAELAWSVDGAADFYLVQVYELIDAFAVTYPVYVDEITSAVPHAQIDGELLQPGRYYVFVVLAMLGAPGAASGDLVTSSFPFGIATATSSSFTPQLPAQP